MLNHREMPNNSWPPINWTIYPVNDWRAAGIFSGPPLGPVVGKHAGGLCCSVPLDITVRPPDNTMSLMPEWDAITQWDKSILLHQYIHMDLRNYQWTAITAGATWKQYVRHHLSLNRLFERRPRPATDPGFASYWTVNLTASSGTKRPRKRGPTKNSGPSFCRCLCRRPWRLASPHDEDVERSYLRGSYPGSETFLC
ncbi:hypothetical protein B0H13DRAFT_1863892 [Mycena leptocephala]|nr:hypothetical protein B0H13DRAFT_1863892 [Mycena leptocephala]